jgi:hypothetical protein
MPALPSLALAPRHSLARTLVVRLASNAAGFALCYVLLVEALWALGERYVAPLVPRPPDSVFIGSGGEFFQAQDYVRTFAYAMCVPSAIFALALVGFALWRHRLWYTPGALLGLLLGDMDNYHAVWCSLLCGEVHHLPPHDAFLLANGLGLILAAQPAARFARFAEMPMPRSHWLRRYLPTPRRATAALALPLALVALLLAGCENTAGHHVGDTISNATVRITLKSVAVVPSDATFQPAVGDELVRLHVRYTNWSRTVLNFNEVQFALQNGGATSDCGRDHEVGCGVPRDGTYSHYGDQGVAGYPLQSGATIESDMLFEVGKSAHDARLVYQPDGMDDIANFWWLLGL